MFVFVFVCDISSDPCVRARPLNYSLHYLFGLDCESKQFQSGEIWPNLRQVTFDRCFVGRHILEKAMASHNLKNKLDISGNNL